MGLPSASWQLPTTSSPPVMGSLIPTDSGQNHAHLSYLAATEHVTLVITPTVPFFILTCLITRSGGASTMPSFTTLDLSTAGSIPSIPAPDVHRPTLKHRMATTVSLLLCPGSQLAVALSHVDHYSVSLALHLQN